jgi:hypothetical protein
VSPERELEDALVAQSHKGRTSPPPTSGARPAWYALGPGGWRDYVTVLHPPYTAWHLSYVVIGGCLAPVLDWERLGLVVAAFALAVGVGAHALDELTGRPLGTRIPDRVLLGLAIVSVAGACAIGVAGALAYESWLALLVPAGLLLVLAYNLELAGGRLHTDLWFGLAWGGFPALCGYAVVAGEITVVAGLAALFAVLLSLAQRALSNPVRHVRRRASAVRGEIVLRDGGHEELDAERLTAPAETALRLLTAATIVLAATLLALRISWL